MDWNLVWSAVGGVAATLTFLLTLFLEWPRFRDRWAMLSSARIMLQISIVLLGVVGLFLYGASVTLDSQTSPLDNAGLGRPGFLLMLGSTVAMTLHGTWMAITERTRNLYALLALASIFLITLVEIWFFFHWH